MAKSHTGFVAKCTPQGQIIEIVLDDYNLLQVGVSMISLMDKSSTGKFFSFLKDVQDNRATLGWEVNFNLKHNIKTYFLAASLDNVDGEELLYVIGSTESNSMRKFYDDIMKINNEQTNNIRSLLKISNKIESSIERKNDSFDGLTKLNNEMANLQRELSKKNMELDRANVKLKELDSQKNKFLGMASHDLRNPLSVIQHYSNQLLKGSFTLEELKEMLEDINSSSSLMFSLVNDFLDVTKIESGEFELKLVDVSLKDLIITSIKSNTISAKKKDITLISEFLTDDDTIHADSTKVIQVLNNFIGNAVKYSPLGTTTRVSLKNKETSILVEVIDEGQGIPADEIADVFVPYKTTSVKSTAGEKSTGLGLSIVTKIIDAHSGSYGVKSEVGKGSTFWFSIPKTEVVSNESIIETNGETKEKFSENELKVNFHKMRFMLVEDDIMIRTLHERTLKGFGAEVVNAENGQIALEIYQNDSNFDAILMDVNMPVLDGLEATAKLRSLTNGDKIVILGLSGISSESDKQKMLDAGMNEALTKPIQKGPLQEVLQNILKS